MRLVKISINYIVDTITEAVSALFSHCSDDRLRLVLILSCVSFHIGWRHKAYQSRFAWKDKSYPRTLMADIKLILRLSRNEVVFMENCVVAAMFQPVSDPSSMAWGGCHDSLLAHFFPTSESSFFEERYLGASWPLFSVVLFAGYLKRSGDLVSAETLYRKLIANELSRFEGYMGLADIQHLLANWRLEIQEYKAAGVYPTDPIAPNWKFADKVWDLESFNFEGAIDLYRQALTVRPDSAFALSHLARAYVDSGGRALGALTYKAAADLWPSNTLLQIRCGYAQALEGQRGAMRRLRKILSSDHDLYCGFAAIRRVSLRPARDVARLLDQDAVALTPECWHTGSYMVAVGRDIYHRSFSIRLPAPISFELSNVREIGLGGKVVEDRLLIADSKHLGVRQLKMFSPRVLMHDGKTAVLGFQREVQYYRSKRVVLLPPCATFNYYHFILETLGSLLLLEKHYDLSDFDLIISTDLKDYQRRLLESTLSTKPRVFELKNDSVSGFLFGRVRHLPFPSRWSVPHPKVVLSLRQRLSRHSSFSTKGKRVYLSRQSVRSGRKTLNEKAIETMLGSRGFITKDPALMTIDEQIEFFRDVEILVSPAGAALTNLIFCPSSVIVVALTTAYHHSEVFTSIAAALNQQIILCVGPSQTIPNPFFFWSTLDLEVDISTLTVAIDWAIRQIPP